MHDDMAEMLEQANEIQETMGRSYAVPDEIDEADLEAGVAHSPFLPQVTLLNLYCLELEALSSELPDEETPSYLSEMQPPDFIDAPPVEVSNIYDLPN